MRAARTMACLALSLAGLAGCGPSKGPIPVRGRVTVAGQPLTGGELLFFPADSAVGRTGRATVGTDGTYEASTFQLGDGLLPGEYQIIVGQPQPLFDVSRPTSTSTQVRKKYADVSTSGLVVRVCVGDAPHVLDLALDSQ